MTQTVFLLFFTKIISPSRPAYVPESNILGILIFCVAIQSIITIGLHCAELQVILLRDEAIWRTLSSPRGSKSETTYNSITQPLQSRPQRLIVDFQARHALVLRIRIAGRLRKGSADEGSTHHLPYDPLVRLSGIRDFYEFHKTEGLLAGYLWSPADDGRSRG